MHSKGRGGSRREKNGTVGGSPDGAGTPRPSRWGGQPPLPLLARRPSECCRRHHGRGRVAGAESPQSSSEEQVKPRRQTLGTNPQLGPEGRPGGAQAALAQRSFSAGRYGAVTRPKRADQARGPRVPPARGKRKPLGPRGRRTPPALSTLPADEETAAHGRGAAAGASGPWGLALRRGLSCLKTGRTPCFRPKPGAGAVPRAPRSPLQPAGSGRQHVLAPRGGWACRTEGGPDPPRERTRRFMQTPAT